MFDCRESTSRVIKYRESTYREIIYREITGREFRMPRPPGIHFVLTLTLYILEVPISQLFWRAIRALEIHKS